MVEKGGKGGGAVAELTGKGVDVGGSGVGYKWLLLKGCAGFGYGEG